MVRKTSMSRMGGMRVRRKGKNLAAAVRAKTATGRLRAKRTGKDHDSPRLVFDDESGRDMSKEVSFGSVTVRHQVPDDRTVSANILAGQEALMRARDAFIQPGVVLRRYSGVPLFSVDAHDPTILVRDLDGRIDRGSLIDGRFVPSE